MVVCNFINSLSLYKFIYKSKKYSILKNFCFFLLYNAGKYKNYKNWNVDSDNKWLLRNRKKMHRIYG